MPNSYPFLYNSNNIYFSINDEISCELNKLLKFEFKETK